MVFRRGNNKDGPVVTVVDTTECCIGTNGIMGGDVITTKEDTGRVVIIVVIIIMNSTTTTVTWNRNRGILHRDNNNGTRVDNDCSRFGRGQSGLLLLSLKCFSNDL